VLTALPRELDIWLGDKGKGKEKKEKKNQGKENRCFLVNGK